ncbi:1,3-beta-glucanosyltransferase gel4 [Ilyonectria robusta]
MTMLKLSVSLFALATCALGADLPSIEKKGSKFFFSNGTQFFLKGVGYQQDSSAAGATTTNSTFVDPLADEARCKEDIPLLAELGTNIIRTYAIDPTADHSACMKLLNDAGIYVISDLSEPSLSIDRSDPAWDVELFNHYKAVVDAMAGYSNVLGFFAGNEVSNQANNTGASAYVKAAVRDTKKYISDKNYRWMGVGYAANDDTDIRDELSAYFNCGDADQSIDFFGYNIYSWCGSSDFEKSGYNRFIDAFKDYSVPVFFAEYGCNLPSGAAKRTFDETTALYSSNMSEVVSGGIVYEYFEETNDYGLVKISSGSATKMADFAHLQKNVRAASPAGVKMSAYTSTNKAASCPTVNSTWAASSSLPPTPNESACSCITNSSSCVPADGLASSKYSAVFDYICGVNSTLCDPINGNATTGVYGTFSMCSDVDKLAYVLNAYYESQGKASTACDFNGKAQTQKASTTSGDCIKLAASSNTTSSSSSSTSSSVAIVGAPMTHAFTLGGFGVSLYMAVLVGAGMLAL